VNIVSHRGFWRSPDEKNIETAFRRSFQACFGIETDIRDCSGKLVISHDVPMGQNMKMDALLRMMHSCPCRDRLILALNIKADGLVQMVSDLLAQYQGLDCFVFDMAVPDMRSYLLSDIPVFTRLSEIEQSPIWLGQSAGVWLDCFESEWYSMTLIEELLSEGKRVCIVSPELHGRLYEGQWEKLRDIDHRDLMLCTDHPDAAAAYFGKG